MKYFKLNKISKNLKGPKQEVNNSEVSSISSDNDIVGMTSEL